MFTRASRFRCTSFGVRSIAIFGVLSAGLGTGCGGEGKNAGAIDPALSKAKRSTAIAHEPCNHADTTQREAAGGASPSISVEHYPDSNIVKCRVIDFNGDGKHDFYEYFTQHGQLRRREVCYNDMGTVNSVETFEGGKLVRREMDTIGARKVDTWDYFDAATGKRLRRERDVDGDGLVDQWWSWQGDKLSVIMRRDGNGNPDQNSMLLISGSPLTGEPAVASDVKLDGGVSPSRAASLDAGTTTKPTTANAPEALKLDAGMLAPDASSDTGGKTPKVQSAKGRTP